MVASGKFGISGMKIRGMFEGKWVKTIVLTNPNRLASQAAARADRPASTSQDGATLWGPRRSLTKKSGRLDVCNLL